MNLYLNIVFCLMAFYAVLWICATLIRSPSKMLELFRHKPYFILIAYVILIPVFGLLYMEFDVLRQEDIKWRWDYFYFSSMTLFTVGYGDFSPVENVGKVLVIIQAFLGYILIGMFFWALGVSSEKLKLNVKKEKTRSFLLQRFDRFLSMLLRHYWRFSREQTGGVVINEDEIIDRLHDPKKFAQYLKKDKYKFYYGFCNSLDTDGDQVNTILKETKFFERDLIQAASMMGDYDLTEYQSILSFIETIDDFCTTYPYNLRPEKYLADRITDILSDKDHIWGRPLTSNIRKSISNL